MTTIRNPDHAARVLAFAEKQAERKGYSIAVNTPQGVVFACRYRADDTESLFEAIRNTLRHQGNRFFDIVVSRCDEPPEPMSMEQWIASGGTTD